MKGRSNTGTRTMKRN